YMCSARTICLRLLELCWRAALAWAVSTAVVNSLTAAGMPNNRIPAQTSSGKPTTTANTPIMQPTDSPNPVRNALGRGAGRLASSRVGHSAAGGWAMTGGGDGGGGMVWSIGAGRRTVGLAGTA